MPCGTARLLRLKAVWLTASICALAAQGVWAGALTTRLDEPLDKYRPCHVLPSADRIGSAPAILPKLAQEWAAAFEARHRAVQIRMPPPHDGPQGQLSETLARFLRGGLDFALLTRELTATDLETYQRGHGGPPIVIPVARGSFREFGLVDTIVIIVHQDNPLRGLSYAQVDAVYSQSRLHGGTAARVWGDLGLSSGPWSSRPIRALGGGREGEDDSAKAATVRRRVLSIGAARGIWRADIDAAGRGPDGVAARVAADRNAIGITALGHLVPGVRAVPISVAASGPFVAPTWRHVVAGRYPLVRTIDLILSRSRKEDPVLLEFARFLISRQGQEIVRDHGHFLPLETATARESRRAIDVLAPCSR